MYCRHFGLDAKPFSITPDPRFLFLSERHREALAHLLYGVGEGGGFVQLTGEVGTGKTTLCRALLEQLPQSVDIALILNPKLSGLELVAAVCDELKVDYPRDTQSLKVLVDHLNEHLLRAHAAGRRTVLVIDEAQNLSAEVLEQIRLLTNLETAQAKLLQIILIGQPELQALLARNELRQLAQRITARYHLGSLSRAETQIYIAHRLKVSGGHGNLFTRGAIDAVQRLSGGTPRLINVLCDRALLGAYVEDRQRVDARLVRRAAREVLPEVQAGYGARSIWPWVAGVALVAGAAVLGWRVGDHPQDLLSFGGVASEEARPAATDAPHAGPGEPGEPDKLAAFGTVAGTTSPDPLQDDAELLPPPTTMDAESPPPVAALGAALLTAAADESSELLTWSGLFKLWDAALYLDGQLQPCDQAAHQGLRCLVRAGNWTQLRSLDRPAVLQMIAPDGRRVSALLRSLDTDAAGIEVGGELLHTPLAGIERYWHGQFVLLWRPPVGHEVLRTGARGADVAWLHDLLDRLQPDAAGGAGAADVYDTALAERVRRFQAAHALEADGVVGTLTLIHLNSADRRSGGPRLSGAALARDG
ncbi:MAG: AAA family ATPase [Gammaproteobacteria bacterium]|nr:AAA family ATPase [Gammaproteobacteria bacterium]